MIVKNAIERFRLSFIPSPFTPRRILLQLEAEGKRYSLAAANLPWSTKVYVC